MESMKAAWKEAKVKVSGSRVVNIEQVCTHIDQNILTTKSVLEQPLPEGLAADATSWLEKMNSSLEALESCKAILAISQYLAPSIAQNSPLFATEREDFAETSANWREIRGVLSQHPHVDTLTSHEIASKLEESRKLLDKIQHSLNQRLQKARDAFPRLYFISQDKLLDLLVSPSAVSKIAIDSAFYGVKELVLSPDQEITALVPPNGTKLQLQEPVKTAGRNLEDWLNDLERVMKASVERANHEALATHSNSKLGEWFFGQLE